MQLLRIQVRNRFLHGPFAKPPCENENVKPLAEALGQLLAQNVTNYMVQIIYIIL